MNYVLNRWKVVHQLFLEKDMNSPKIHRFRNIHLIEADLNFVMKIIWAKKLPRFFEEKKLLEDTQYGGRKRRRTQSVILNKIFSYDSCRILQQTANFQDNDAKNCYDRILMPVSEICLRRLGMTGKAVKLQTKVLKMMTHFILTNKGVSEECWQYSQEFKIFGSGQGTRWSLMV